MSAEATTKESMTTRNIIMFKNFLTMQEIWKEIQTKFPDHYIKIWATLVDIVSSEGQQKDVQPFLDMMLGYKSDHVIFDSAKDMFVELLYLFGCALQEGEDPQKQGFVYDYIFRSVMYKPITWEYIPGKRGIEPNRIVIDKGFAAIDDWFGQKSDTAHRWITPYIEKYSPEHLPLWNEKIMPQTEDQYWRKYSYIMGCYYIARNIAKGSYEGPMDADYHIRQYFNFPHPMADNLRVLPGGRSSRKR